MSFAVRDAFLKPIELKSIEFDCRLGKVRMKELSGSEMSGLRDWVSPDGKRDQKRAENFALKLVTMAVVNEAGERILSEEDIELIDGYPTTLKHKLLDNALQLNGLAKKGQEVVNDLRGKSSS